jgi:uncharacterized protein (DUF433 family)
MKGVKAMLDRISINENICHGRACIKGTQIPVHQILQMFANGDTIDDLLKAYPSITREDILSCLAFAANLTNRKINKQKFEKIRFKEAKKIENSVKKAEALREFVYSLNDKWIAIKELGNCGEAALPIFRELKNDPLLKKDYLNILTIYGRIGGDDAGDEIASIIRTDLEYWKGIAPELKAEWFNHEDMNFNLEIYNRYIALTHLIRILEEIKSRKCREVVGEVKDLWQSVNFDEIVGDRFMSDICNSILNPIDKNSPVISWCYVSEEKSNKLEE